MKEKTKSKYPLISSIERLYYFLVDSDILVFASSIIFFAWFLSLLTTDYTILVLILWGAIQISLLLNLKRLKGTKFSVKDFRKTLNIPGSLLVLFLFLNSYLRISESMAQEFLTQVERVERIFSSSFLDIFLSFIIIFYFVFLLKRLAFNRKERRRTLWQDIIFPLLILGFLFTFAVVFRRHIVKYLFGFSLIFIHLSYLIKETKTFLKSQIIPKVG